MDLKDNQLKKHQDWEYLWNRWYHGKRLLETKCVDKVSVSHHDEYNI